MKEETIAKVVELTDKLKELEAAKERLQSSMVRIGYTSNDYQGNMYAITNNILQELAEAHDACIRSEIDGLITKYRNELREL